MPAAGADRAFWACRRCRTPNPVATYLTTCLACGSPRPPASGDRRPWSSLWIWRRYFARLRPRRPIRPPTLNTRGAACWWLGPACWSYAALIAMVVAALNLAGDWWWAATLALFGPRWIWALPMVLVLPTAFRRRAARLPAAVASILLVLPLMGFCIPWGRPLTMKPGAVQLRVLTCNIEGNAADPERLGLAIDEAEPDIVLFQEGTVGRLPARFRGGDWTIRGSLASRLPVLGSERMDPAELAADGSVERFDLEVGGLIVHVFNVHLESPREGLQAVIDRGPGGPDALAGVIALRARQSEAASQWIRLGSEPDVIAGDFNMPVESAIYRRSWGDFANAFSRTGFGFGHTKFTRWHGIRIDHVLGGSGWRPSRCWVGPDVGSDHRPVIADFEWLGRPVP